MPGKGHRKIGLSDRLLEVQSKPNLLKHAFIARWYSAAVDSTVV